MAQHAPIWKRYARGVACDDARVVVNARDQITVILHLAASAAALPAMSRVAIAQAYPSRPITLGSNPISFSIAVLKSCAIIGGRFSHFVRLIAQRKSTSSIAS
jgi:hypothetical protein